MATAQQLSMQQLVSPLSVSPMAESKPPVFIPGIPTTSLPTATGADSETTAEPSTSTVADAAAKEKPSYGNTSSILPTEQEPLFSSTAKHDTRRSLRDAMLVGSGALTAIVVAATLWSRNSTRTISLGGRSSVSVSSGLTQPPGEFLL